MGPRLTNLAALIVFATAPALADGAADLVKQGIDLYKEGKFDEARVVLQKAYDLDRKPDTLFALAQAERKSGDCKAAAAHYHTVIEQVNDFNVAKLVLENLGQCEKLMPAVEPKNVPEVKPAAQPPQVITKIEVHEVRHNDMLAASMFAIGTLGLGVAGGLYIAASSNRDAADTARTLDDHDRLADRASKEQTAMFVAGGLGVAVIGVAIFRWTRSDERSPAVAIAPVSNGGSVWVTGHW